MQKINNIAKNTSFLTLALIIQKVISFSYFTILARNLEPDNLGKYYFAISFITIFAIFIDLGLINVITREVAKKQEGAQKILGNVIFLKIPLAIASLVAVFITINLISEDSITKNLVYIASICMILDSFASTFLAVIRGFHTLIFESINAIVFQIIIMSWGLFAIYSGKSLYWILFALVLGSIFYFVYSAAVLFFKFKIKIVPHYDVRMMRLLFKIAIPFGIFAIFQKLYTYLDTIMLSILAGDRYVGLYQIAFKIIFALQFLPMAFTASLYPAMSSYWVSNKNQLKVTFERAMNYLIIISLPISFGVASIADKILLIFKESYVDAVIPMQVIMMALLFLFINFPIGSLLNACDRQKINTINMGIVLVASVVLNILLIPRYQAVGASITVLTTNALMFTLGIAHVGKIISYRPLIILRTFFKALIASLVMVWAVLWLKTSLNIFLVILIGGVIYFSLVFIFGGFKKEDIISVYKSLFKK